jgi:hypothetical protein
LLRKDIEEEIPLNPTAQQEEEEETFRQRKGKERAEEPSETAIFNVGDSDDDEGGYKDEVRDP